MNGALPWSLDDLSEHELALLLSGSRVGTPYALAEGGIAMEVFTTATVTYAV